MFRCSRCALAFVHPLPSDDYLIQFYSTFHTALAKGGSYELIEERMKADFPAKVKKVLSFRNGSSFMLLDVGCGKGFFVKACADAGVDAQGIDLSDTAVNHAVEKLGVRATCGTLEENINSIGQFDVVTFWATLEHLPRPVNTLNSIRSILRPGGLLLLDTGIGNDWLDRMLPGVNQWYDPPQHLYVFTRQAIAIALDRAGFDIVDLDCNFERSTARRIARVGRGAVAAIGLRTAATIGRCLDRSNGFGFTRFPIGNLMSVTARKR